MLMLLSVKIRPSERWNFPKFVLSRKSELFCFQNLEFFWKILVVSFSQNKFGNKYENATTKISLEINQICKSNTKLNYVTFRI
jgi:hypothetical protein